MVSIVAHGCILVLALIALKETPSVHVQPAATRYTVRILKLHTTNPQIHWAAAGSAPPASTQPTIHTARNGGSPAAPSIPQHMIQQTSARATLVQPNVPLHTLLPLQTPIPLVVMLSPQNVPVPKIVPPPAQKAVMANARPSFTLPNHEARVADLKLSAAAAVSSMLPIQPSTTTPIEMHQAQMMKVPQTTSSAAQLPKPATIVSISDLVVMEGTIALPLANETAAASAAEFLTPGRPENTAKVGHGTRLGKQSGNGAGNDQQAQETVGNGAPGRPGASSAGDLASSDGSLAGNQPTVTRITLPKDGRFGVVVVGSSLAEEYPETQATWGNRLAYTVYLHVGATKNWILQYSLPPAVEAAGRTTRPDAPWPYMIMRPNLAPGDQDSDAILVHGLVNGEGRFEQLAVVFPPEFPQTKFVLDALQQWQFRPASQNGRSAAVEVLLIIPDASE
jgi:hypothetical protein